MNKLELKPITLASLAGLSGLFAGMLALAITWLAGYPKPWIYAVLGWAAISAISWLALMRRYLAIFQDRNDANLKPAKVYDTSTRIEVIANDPAGAFSAGRFAELPITLDQLIKVAKRLDSGVSFSHAGLAGPGRPLSRSDYEQLRDRMLSDGLCYWINPSSHSQGVNLTRAGERVFQYFARFQTKKKPTPQRPGTYKPIRKSSRAAHAHTRTRGNGRRQLIRD